MSRNVKRILTIVVMGSMLLTVGCSKASSEYPEFLTKNSWERSSGSCIETLYFDNDGKFGYSCSCGNPVGDSDLYDNYSYDDSTREITLSSGEDEIIIKVIESSDESLTLEFPEKLGEGKKTFSVSTEEF